MPFDLPKNTFSYSHLSSYLSLNREGRWGTTDDFATSFLHFPLFSIVILDFAKSRPVHSPMMSSHLFLCLLVFFPLSLCLARLFWLDLMNGSHVQTTAILRLFTMVRRSSCGPMACWILAWTSSFVTWSLYEMHSILR